jgi:hypothetical protein
LKDIYTELYVNKLPVAQMIAAAISISEIPKTKADPFTA